MFGNRQSANKITGHPAAAAALPPTPRQQLTAARWPGVALSWIVTRTAGSVISRLRVACVRRSNGYICTRLLVSSSRPVFLPV